jgi:Zn-dependent membrane protease YugP
MYWYGFDSTYFIMVLPAIFLAMWAQARVKTTFSKYSRVRSIRGLTGADTARMILDRNGLSHIAVEHVSGRLSDHYDPRSQVIRLSDSVYGDSSVAAIGVAAHEAGHALQHSTGYTPLKLRNAVIPVTNIVSNLSIPLILLGIILNSQNFVVLGIVAFSLAVAVQVITLPVEFNASARAINILGSSNMLYEEELEGAKRVLKAAALTYVAAMIVAVAQLLRLVILFGGRNRD